MELVLCSLCSVGSPPLTCLAKPTLTVSKQTPASLIFTHPMISGNSLYVTLKKRAWWLLGFTLQLKSDKCLASGVSPLCSCWSCPLVPSGFLRPIWRPQSGGRSLPIHIHFDLFKFSNLDIKTQNWDFPFPPHPLPTRQQ